MFVTRKGSEEMLVTCDGLAHLANVYSGQVCHFCSVFVGSRGEGAVLLQNGHLLAAKEKKPAALIEFGPLGAEPVGLAKGGALRNRVRWPVMPDDHEYGALDAGQLDEILADACEEGLA
jgi:hypothetical protein